MDVGALAGGSGLEFAGAWYNNRMAMERQMQAQGWESDQFDHRYQRMVNDLKAAGLNPMLAYTQGPGPAPSSSAASAQGISSGSAVFNDTRVASAQEARLMAETKNIEQDTVNKTGIPALYEAQARQASQSAEQSKAMSEKIKVEIPKVAYEIKNLQSLTEKNKSDISLNNSLITANAVLTGLRSAEAILAGARTRVSELEAETMMPKAKASKYHSAELGHVAENIGKIGTAAWKFMFPTLQGGGN